MTDNNNNNNTEATMKAEKQPTKVIASLTNPGTEVNSLMIHPCGSTTIHLAVRDGGYPWGGKHQTEVLEELHEEVKACGFEFKGLTTWVKTPRGHKPYNIQEWDALSDEERLPMDISHWCSNYEKWTGVPLTGTMTCTNLFVYYNNLDRHNKAEEGGE